MKHIINVDISSTEDILDTLDYLSNNYDKIAQDSYKNFGIEFYDKLTGNLIELETPIHPEIPNYSELAFYLKAIQSTDSSKKVEKITHIVIAKNSPKSIWMNKEIQMGLSAAFALAFHNKTYISNFVSVLRTFDLNHEVYEPFFIELLLDKWKVCDEILFLLATRSGSISGQWALEGYDIPMFTNEQKNKFLRYLLEDTLKSKAVFTEVLLDSIESLNININKEEFESYFEHHKPLFDKDTIPNLAHISND